jgi:predicted PurR-regulated permease PerM
VRIEIDEEARQRMLGVLLLGLTLLLVHLLGPVLTPFVVAMALAYLWDPVVDRLERTGLSRTLGVCVVFLAMTLLIVALVLVLLPLLGRQMQVLAQKVPVGIEWFRGTLLPWLQQRFQVSPSDIPLERIRQGLMDNWQSAGGIAQNILVSATTSSIAVLGWFANLVLIPVVTFYLLRDWDRIVAGVHESLPRAWEPTVVQLARECDEVIGAFIRGQLLVMLALGVCYTAGLLLVGLDLALLIGTLAGLASIVPYLGLVIGIGAASVAALIQFGEWLPLVWVALVFVVAQMAEGMYLTPKLVGDRIGMHPVLVIFAVMAGGHLFGFTGILLGLPVAAVILVLLRHVHARYRASRLYGAAGASVLDSGDFMSGSVGDALADAALPDTPGGGGSP